ncbi:MAG: ATP-binding protein [Desulfobulbaceae bacterium]|nr:ATP-binding protein [Desulfobulbaceae bacterium]
MNEKSIKAKHIFNALCVAVIALVSFNYFYIFPLFDNFLLTSMERDAAQIVTHFQHLCPSCFAGPPPPSSAINEIVEDFDLKRVIIFSANGTIIYASQPADRNTINKSKEVFDTVKKGINSSKIVRLNQQVGNDFLTTFIAETIIPVMQKGVFKGAIEIDRDLTLQQNHLNTIKILAGGLLALASGGILSFLWIFVQKASRAEKELRRAHDQLTTAIDAIPDTFLVIDRNYKIVMANKAVRQAAGGDPVSKNLCCHHVSHHQDTPCTGSNDPCPLPLVLQHKKPVNILHTHYTASGESRWVDITASPIFDEDGKVIQMIESCKDITLQKIAENALLKSKEELQESNRHLQESISLANKLAIEADRANAAKSDFLANMSHEIRTPMNGVIGMTDLLLNTNPSAEQRDYLSTIRSSADALLFIINDILDFSKIEAGKLTLEAIDFDLAALVEECSDLLAISAQKKGVEFICQIDSQLPCRVHGDPVRLRQVISNLTSNAIKFTSHGEVSIKIRQTELFDKKISLLVEISDTGIGIDSQEISSLFKPFVQADTSTTRNFGGTGLGLAICKQLVELMNGQIGVKSQKGEGSLFWFTAKLDQTVQPSPSISTSTPLLDAGMRVLVVDNNSSCRQCLTLMLAELGCFTSEAASKAEALSLLRQAMAAGTSFQAVLLGDDLSDDPENSLWALLSAENDYGTPSLLLMSPMSRQTNSQELKKKGISALLDKPIKRQALATAMIAVQHGQSSFPLSRAVISETTPFESLSSALRPGAKVLLAEDNLTNQKVAFGLLNKFGIEPVVVTNGQEALRAFQDDTYDLIFMDCQMPLMDGLVATANIRAIEKEGERIPIVAMTAHALTGDREKCLASGMDDYLSKPLSIRALALVLLKWLGREVESNIPCDIIQGLPEQMAVEKNTLILDRTDLLCRLMDDRELAEEVLAVFLDDMPSKIAALRAAVESGDALQIKDQGHTVKGAARNISALAFQEIAWQLEEAGREGEIDKAVALLPLLDSQYLCLQNEIRQFID